MAGVRILLVEDEGLIRMVTADFLQDEGFEVTEAWNGDDATRLLDNSDGFDILFTDVQMPGKLDGLEVATHARRLHPLIPVLVVSGYAAQLVSRLGMLHPAAAFVGKPYDLKEIVDVLKRLSATS